MMMSFSEDCGFRISRQFHMRLWNRGDRASRESNNLILCCISKAMKKKGKRRNVTPTRTRTRTKERKNWRGNCYDVGQVLVQLDLLIVVTTYAGWYQEHKNVKYTGRKASIQYLKHGNTSFVNIIPWYMIFNQRFNLNKFNKIYSLERKETA